MKAQPAPIQRLALTRAEAASAIGVSLTWFADHVQPELKLIRRGSVRLVPITELTRWIDRNAEHLIQERPA